jgi:hypothetical protein
VVHCAVDLRDVHCGLDLIDPVIVTRVGLGEAGEAQCSSDQAARDDSGETELLHGAASFFILLFEPWRAGRGSDDMGAGFEVLSTGLVVQTGCSEV